MQKMDEALDEYVSRFFGYGDLNAPLWFVGMEEGGEPDSSYLSRRLHSWSHIGKPSVADITSGQDVNKSPWFSSNKPPIQRTWGKLIRATLISNGEDFSLGSIRKYQAQRLARHAGETCLLELMPLPAKKLTSWPYATLSGLDYLSSREAYFEAVAPSRRRKLSSLIEQHRPRAVVFYSSQYFLQWKEVAGGEANWEDKSFGKEASNGNTSFFCTPHPTAFGTTNETYEALGKRLNQLTLRSTVCRSSL
jgi:hypothetical protein